MNILVIGRWQPFHNGHLKLMKDAAKRGHLIIVVGSALESRTRENPYSYLERAKMIREALGDEGMKKFSIVPIPDVHDDAIWFDNIAHLCPKIDLVITGNPWPFKIFTSKGFRVEEPKFYNKDEWNGTHIRQRMRLHEPWEHMVPPTVAKIMKKIGLGVIN